MEKNWCKIGWLFSLETLVSETHSVLKTGKGSLMKTILWQPCSCFMYLKIHSLKAFTKKVWFCLCYSLNQGSELHTKETINLESTLHLCCLFHPKVLHGQYILLQKPKKGQQRTTAFAQYSYPWASSITEIFTEQEDLEKNQLLWRL